MPHAISKTCCACAISTAWITAAGNVALVDALLARGADPLLEDEFGHTPWHSALNRAMEDTEFARQSIGPLFERIALPVLDVQTDGRLVRLERHQG